MADRTAPSTARSGRKPVAATAPKATVDANVRKMAKPVVERATDKAAGKPAPTASVAETPVPETAASTVAAPIAAAETVAAEIEDAMHQAGVVAAEAIEPVAQAARAAVEIETTAEPTRPMLRASPLFNLMKGMTMATAFDSSKTNEMLGDMNQKAKGAMEKGAKFAEEFQEFAKGNVEAMVASGRVAAKGVEEMAQYGADYGRKTVEQATTAMKSLAGVKSPTDLFQLQSEYAKSAVDSMVAETSKFTESYIKLLGDIAQPLTSRYAVAAEKIKAVAA